MGERPTRIYDLRELGSHFGMEIPAGSQRPITDNFYTLSPLARLRLLANGLDESTSAKEKQQRVTTTIADMLRENGNSRRNQRIQVVATADLDDAGDVRLLAGEEISVRVSVVFPRKTRRRKSRGDVADEGTHEIDATAGSEHTDGPEVEYNALTSDNELLSHYEGMEINEIVTKADEIRMELPHELHSRLLNHWC